MDAVNEAEEAGIDRTRSDVGWVQRDRRLKLVQDKWTGWQMDRKMYYVLDRVLLYYPLPCTKQ
jgi:hypothetical protein